jgi:hypothetical protein
MAVFQMSIPGAKVMKMFEQVSMRTAIIR